MRTSPRAVFPPDLNSSTLDPVRPVSGLEYSPTHLPTSTLRSAPATGTTGAGLSGVEEDGDEDEQEAARANPRAGTSRAASNRVTRGIGEPPRESSFHSPRFAHTFAPSRFRLPIELLEAAVGKKRAPSSLRGRDVAAGARRRLARLVAQRHVTGEEQSPSVRLPQKVPETPDELGLARRRGPVLGRRRVADERERDRPSAGVGEERPPV